MDSPSSKSHILLVPSRGSQEVLESVTIALRKVGLGDGAQMSAWPLSTTVNL